MHKYLLILVLMFCVGCSAPMRTDSKAFIDRYGDYDYCKIETTKQQERNSCGTACLVSVMNYWDVKIVESYILEKYSKDSCYSVLDLKYISINEGLDAYILSMKESPEKQLEEQISKGRPLICAVLFPEFLYLLDGIPIKEHIYRGLTWALGARKSHFVVVVGYNDKNIILMDPSRGLVDISKKHFYECWKKKNYASILCGKKEII